MSSLTYVIDIDGTICSQTDGDYSLAVPFENRITLINDLYEQGHHIIYFTARGMGSTNNNISAAYAKMYSFTEKQLSDWGAKYHSLFLGKPRADLYIDDKAMKDSNFFDSLTGSDLR